ncbi:MAG: DUF5667 domain-containing protein [Aeromicrobium sp.]
MIGPRASIEAEAFADALEGRGPRNGETRELVRFAESLCEAAVDPSPAFLLSLRAELMSDASTVLVAARKTDRTATFDRQVSRPLRRRFIAAAATVVAMSGTVGLVASSAQAIPGDMLYSVKRGVESVELAMHRGDASRGSFELSQASERLAEARALSGQQDSRSQELVVNSLSEFTDKASAGSQSLFADFSNGGDRKAIDKVSDFANSSNSILAEISNKLPTDSTAAFKAAASTVTDLVAQATSLCVECNVPQLASLATEIKSATTQSSPKKSQSSSSKPTSSVPSTVDSVATSDTSPVVPTQVPPIVVPTVPAANVPDTDPIVGALLGDDDQVGVVPGLLGALLGPK